MPAYSQASQEACYRGSEGVDLNAKNIILEARKNKAQITLEFLLVYSLVLIVFLIIFALIVAQRASTLASQEYSSMQLVAQTVSTAIDTALSSGSGYTATVQLPSAFGTAPYNLSISSTGVIIASMLVGKEVVSAQAFSNARSLVVNGTVVASGNGITLYKVPAYKGSVYIANSNGVIYINQQPVSTLALAKYLNVNVSFNGKVAQFNGQIGQYIAYSGSLNIPNGNPITIAAWINYKGNTGNWEGIAGINWVCPFEHLAVSTNKLYLDDCGNDGGNFGSFTVPKNQWVFVAYTLNGDTLTFYENGASQTFTTSGTYQIAPTALDIGTEGVDFNRPSFNGSISDVQIYNTLCSNV